MKIMTFLALLVKEMRLTFRRERTIWLIITYILLMGVVGWYDLRNLNTGADTDWSSIGPNLYSLLLIVQLLLVLFIAPTFTATSINGEKERQTFDLLLCSRLSPLSLAAGKLLAGLTSALLLIGASIPLFSLVFFFGGISPGQALAALFVFVVSALLVTAVGLFCSTLVTRPAVSTALAYTLVLLWFGLPILFALLNITTTSAVGTTATSGTASFHSSNSAGISTQTLQNPPPAGYLAWNPAVALFSTFNNGLSFQGPYQIFSLSLVAWQAYSIISVLVAIIFFAASLFLIRPRNWRGQRKDRSNKNERQLDIETKIPVQA